MDALSIDVDFLAGALQTLTGARIVSHGKDDGASVGSFDLDCLHKRSLQWGGDSVPSFSSSQSQLTFKPLPLGTPRIHIKAFTGRTLELPFLSSEKIIDLKLRIMEKNWASPQDQRLLFAGMQLEDNFSLMYYNIKREATIHLVQRHREPVFTLDPAVLDPDYNYDFTHVRGDGQIFKRGDWRYKRPYGWCRVALNVKDRYKSTGWLGGKDGGLRTDSTRGEWPVSYHATNRRFAEEISKKDKNGRRIYSTPDPNIAEENAQEFKYRGVRYKVILQNRVNMEDTDYVAEEDFFVTKEEKNIRPYGILFKKI